MSETTVKLTALGEHELLPPENWAEYYHQYQEAIDAFWAKWEKFACGYDRWAKDEDLEVMCDSFILKGFQPVPAGFWHWIYWTKGLSGQNYVRAVLNGHTFTWDRTQ